MLFNNTTFPSNTYLIPLEINSSHKSFHKMPKKKKKKEFEIIEHFFLFFTNLSVATISATIYPIEEPTKDT